MARQSQLDAALAKIDAEIVKLQEMRAYLTTVPETTQAPKRTRTRKAKTADDKDGGKF